MIVGQLRSLSRGTLIPLALGHNLLGRGLDGITDLRVSRQHDEIIATGPAASPSFRVLCRSATNSAELLPAAGSPSQPLALERDDTSGDTALSETGTAFRPGDCLNLLPRRYTFILESSTTSSANVDTRCDDTRCDDTTCDRSGAARKRGASDELTLSTGEKKEKRLTAQHLSHEDHHRESSNCRSSNGSDDGHRGGDGCEGGDGGVGGGGGGGGGAGGGRGDTSGGHPLDDWEGLQLPPYHHPPKPVSPEGIHALERLATSPERHPTRIFMTTREFVVAYDAYPKARHHPLVLPRETLSGPWALRGARHAALLERMARLARWLRTRLEEEAGAAPCRLGFHALPSMLQLHLHVISLDLDSPCLKNKKHFNSFTTRFLVSPDEWVRILRAAGGRIEVDAEREEVQLKGRMRCPLLGCELVNMPKVKAHVASARYQQALQDAAKQGLD